MLKLPPRKMEPWFILCSFFLLRLLIISVNLPYSPEWNTVFMSGCMLLAPAWICYINYRNRYVGLLVLHLLPLLNPWFIVKMWPGSEFSIGINLVDVCLNWLNWFHFFILVAGPFFILIGFMSFQSPIVDVTRMSISTVSFLTHLNFGILCLQNAFLWPMI